jgi:hypothetical protein
MNHRSVPTVEAFLKTLLLICFFGASSSAYGQHTLKLYSDEQEMRRAISQLPTANAEAVSGTTPLTAYLNYGLGAQFNRPTSLTAVFCDRALAFASIQEGVSKVLSSAGYDVSPGWDNWGTLKASMQTDSARRDSRKPVIFTSPLRCEDITLKVKLDQIGFSDRALTMDYVVLAGPRTDRSSKKDESSDPLVDRYMDSLFGSLRSTSEAALKAHCTRTKVSDFNSEDAAIQKLAQQLHLDTAQETSIRNALRKDNE